MDLPSGDFINLPEIIFQLEHISVNSLADKLLEIHEVKKYVLMMSILEVLKRAGPFNCVLSRAFLGQEMPS